MRSMASLQNSGHVDATQPAGREVKGEEGERRSGKGRREGPLDPKKRLPEGGPCLRLDLAVGKEGDGEQA